MKQKKSFHWTRVVLAAVIVFFYIPIAYTILFSFNASRSLTTFSGFSLRWYEKMFSSSVTMGAIGTTFAIAILATRYLHLRRHDYCYRSVPLQQAAAQGGSHGK